MSRWSVLLVLLVACAHAKTTDKQDHADAPAVPARVAHQRPPAKPGRPPLAASPEALFNDGGVREIQRALEKHDLLHAHETGHLDEETTAAVRHFQEHAGIASTGVPDHETVRQLGLNPDKLFRRAPPTTPEKEKARDQNG